MDTRRWWGAARAAWRAWQRGADPGLAAGFDQGGGYGLGGTVWRGLSGHSLEMAEVQEEVAAEGRGQVAVLGRSEEANRLLLARLRGQPPAPLAGAICREGFFTLIRLPTPQDAPGVGVGRYPLPGDTEAWSVDDLLGMLAGTDLLLYTFVETAGWQAADAHLYARLRAAGVPMLPVAVDLPPGPLPDREGEQPPACPRREGKQPPACPDREGEQPPACPDREGEPGGLGREEGGPGGSGLEPVRVQVGWADGDRDVITLVERALALRPRLAIPLAQEVPCCRRLIARRMIRSAALLTALVGVEPIPLLDVPVQVALNWKVALQLAAIHGRPGLDYRSREMVGTVALNLGLRYLIQQGAKLVPVLGWLVSAGLSGLGTWLLGNALLRYYEGEPIADFGLRITDWREARSKWQMANGRWQMAKGRWQAIGRWLTVGGWRVELKRHWWAAMGRLPETPLVGLRLPGARSKSDAEG